MEGDQAPKKRLLPMLQLPGNGLCVDCGAADPDWASTNLGIFLCLACSGIHRNLGVHISRVKSVRLDNWKESEVEVMQSVGNTRAKERWEKAVPAYFVVPTEADHINIKEQWIRSKYERKEFDGDGAAGPLLEQVVRCVPEHGAFITKRGNRVKSWKHRWAVLVGSMLMYFKKKTDVACQGHLHLAQATGFRAVPNVDGMEFTWIIETPEREWYMCAETQQSMFEWLSLMRTVHARLVSGTRGNVSASAFDAKAHVPGLKRDITLRRYKFGRVVGQCFLGSQVVDWLMSGGGLESRRAAVEVASRMLSEGVFEAVNGVPGAAFVDGLQGYRWAAA